MRSWFRSSFLRRFGIMSALALASGILLAPDAFGELASHVLVTSQRGELAAASITGTNLGTANTVLTTTKPTVQLIADTDCTVSFMLVRNGADFKRVFAGKAIVIDLKSNAVAFGVSTWKVYYTGSAPSSCTFELTSIPPI